MKMDTSLFIDFESPIKFLAKRNESYGSKYKGKAPVTLSLPLYVSHLPMLRAFLSYKLIPKYFSYNTRMM